MGEVLSQSEIDNLLKQLNSGELDVEEMKILRKRRLRTMICQTCQILKRTSSYA